MEKIYFYDNNGFERSCSNHIEDLVSMPVIFSEIAEFARKELDARICDNFNDFEVSGVASIQNVASGCLAFSNQDSTEIQRCVSGTPNIAVLLPFGAVAQPGVISVENPRLAFAIITAHFFAPKELPGIHPTAIIDDTAEIDETAVIGPYCVVGSNCKVGRRVVLKSHVTLSSNVEIGYDSVIYSHVVIGEDGFAVERSKYGLQVHVPHLGGVKIGRGVHIGTQSAVAAGTIEPTVIGDGTMTDNLVHVAHNCLIGRNCQLTACVEISGSVKIGDNVTLGPNTSIIQKVTIGDNSISGLGAVITKSVAKNVLVAGVPARVIRRLDGDADSE